MTKDAFQFHRATLLTSGMLPTNAASDLMYGTLYVKIGTSQLVIRTIFFLWVCVSCTFEFVSHTYKLESRTYELVSRKYELVRCTNEKVSRKYQFLYIFQRSNPDVQRTPGTYDYFHKVQLTGTTYNVRCTNLYIYDVPITHNNTTY